MLPHEVTRLICNLALSLFAVRNVNRNGKPDLCESTNASATEWQILDVETCTLSRVGHVVYARWSLLCCRRAPPHLTKYVFVKTYPVYKEDQNYQA